MPDPRPFNFDGMDYDRELKDVNGQIAQRAAVNCALLRLDTIS
jgi:hypothetical protein